MTTTDFKLTLLFTTAHALSILVEDMRPYMLANGVKRDWVRETKQAFLDIEGHLRKALTIYETKLEPQRNKCFKDENGNFDAAMYDDGTRDANEILRALLLYYEKCYLNFDNVNSIFKHMRSLEGAGVLSEKYIDSFRIK